MKKMLIPALVVSIVVSSCVKPPQDIEPVNLLSLMEEILLKANEVRFDAAGRRNFSEQGRQLETFIAFYKGSKIIINSHRSEPSARDLLCTNGQNEFLILQDLYATMGPDKALIFSLNGRDWYFGQNDSKKGIYHVVMDYHFDPQFDPKQNILTIGFKGSMRIADEAEPLQLKKTRETVKLESGMVLYDSNDKSGSLDLQEYALYVRRGTIVSMDMQLGGNIVTSESTPERLVITAAKDVFIYRKPNNLAGLSFDNQDWSVSPFAFKIDRSTRVISTGPDSIFVNFNGVVSYNDR